MRLGIVGAMAEELALINEEISGQRVKIKAGKTFYEGIYHGIDIVLTESGIGKVNAAIATQILIDNFQVEGVICTGVAGGLNKKLNTKDIVVSKDVIQHDIDLSEDGYPLGYIPRLDIREIEADDILVNMALQAGYKVLGKDKVLLGRILTGDQFVANDVTAKRLRKEFEGDCVEMEGGAIAQVCYLNNIPFVIIRSISDNADSKAPIDYDLFVKDACKNSFLIVMAMIGEIGQ
ncbi:MAG TPA: 5'-methylthioadenosine/adenosylhomocysteine nucleosidase [Thermoanaerobacterales bacterium]|nr:5'-methylthioadenosine/adenosylhomocysteine nucleosidase [Thermoanaerobacterales bacterium]